MQPVESTDHMAPLQDRLIAPVAIVINHEEAVRLDQLRSSGYEGGSESLEGP